MKYTSIVEGTSADTGLDISDGIDSAVRLLGVTALNFDTRTNDEREEGEEGEETVDRDEQETSFVESKTAKNEQTNIHVPHQIQLVSSPELESPIANVNKQPI